MKNKPSLTVAIPAYNEEKNIVRLLSALVNQTAKNYKLDSISVYSDGSSDNTVALVKTNFPNVFVYNFRKNLGKNRRVNQMMKNNKSDILVQVDADIEILDNRVLDRLVCAFDDNPRIGLVCAYHKALEPRTLFGRLSYFGFLVWDEARSRLGEKGIRYYCEGGMRAFSRSFTKVFRLPLDRHVGEDSYSFYFAVANGFVVVAAEKAVVYIKLADNVHDYVHQMKRFLKDPQMVRETFDKNLEAKYEIMSSGIKFKALLNQLAKDPISGVGYFILQSATKLMAINYSPEKKWQPIERK